MALPCSYDAISQLHPPPFHIPHSPNAFYPWQLPTSAVSISSTEAYLLIAHEGLTGDKH